MTYFGFAVADSMLPECEFSKRIITPDEVRKMAEAGDLVPCINPSHAATIAAMRNRFGIDVAIPKEPPKVSLQPGDRLVVMSVRGLPRLTDRHEYTEEEIAQATFSFSEYKVHDYKVMYLVGIESDLPGQAGFEPKFCSASFKEADKKYWQLARRDRFVGYGFSQAVLLVLNTRDGFLRQKAKYDVNWPEWTPMME